MFLFQVTHISLAATNKNLYDCVLGVWGAPNLAGSPHYLTLELLDKMTPEALREAYPFLAQWGRVRGFFTDDSRAFLDFAYRRAFGGAEKSSAGTFMQEPPSPVPMGAQIRFKDVEGLLRFNSIISEGMNEENKVGLLAAWMRVLLAKYDYEGEGRGLGSLESRPASEVLQRLIAGDDAVGICGDANGSAAHRIAGALGLRHAAGIISSVETGHVISLIRGRNGFYAVDGNSASFLGNDFEAALDLAYANEKWVGKPSMRYSYFLNSGSAGTVFDPGATRKMLDRITGLAGDGLAERGVSLQAGADRYGSAGISADYRFKRLSVGAFVLNAPVANTLFAGMKIDYRAASTTKKRGGRSSIFLPELFLAASVVHDETGTYPFLLAQVVPYMLDQSLGKRTSLRVTPLSARVGFTAPQSVAGEFGSSIGVVRSFGKGGKENSMGITADLRYVPNDEDFYNAARPKVAARVGAGVSGKNYAVSVSLKPQSIDNLVDVNAQVAIPLAKTTKKAINVVLFFEGELFPAKVAKESQGVLGSTTQLSGGAILRLR